MKHIYFTILISFFLTSINLSAQIKFDYTGAELVINYFTDTINRSEQSIIKHSCYQHILNHSKKFSSQALTEENLLNSLKGKSEGFDFSGISDRTDTLRMIIKWLKSNEQNISSDFVPLPLNYLPSDYKQNATIYFVIGGYNGIAFDDKICVNIDYNQFRNNFNEINLYIAHELLHIGFEKYQQLPDIFKAKTVAELKKIVLSMTMNEGLATLTPYHKRLDMNEVSDNDYVTMLDSNLLAKKLAQFDNVMKYLDNNSQKQITNEILGNVLGQCSGDRLFYIVGCYMWLTIETKSGNNKIKFLVKESPEQFFETYYKLL